MSVEIMERGPVAGGKSFGDVGLYEKIEGTIYFEFDPASEANASIVDLDLAPRNDRGLVEARADLLVLRPQDASRGTSTALLEVSNRGGKASLRYYNAASSSDLSTEEAFGDGFLMRRGLTLVWVGWQFDVPEDPARLRLQVPTVAGVEGWARSDWTVDSLEETLDLGHRGHTPYRIVDPGSDVHVLTERDGRLAERRVVPRGQWRFAESGRVIEREGGFPAGRVYELVYRATDPSVVGLGLAAVRDTMAFAKYRKGSPFPVERGFAVGISQTGRFLRHFLHQGFNTDEKGRKAFDGIIAHTAGAGRGSFNHRFAQPSRDAHRYSAFFYPTDIYPFSGRPQRDPLTGKREGLLDRIAGGGNIPKIFYSNTGYEYWGRAASLLHSSLGGSADVEPLDNVRIYHLASCQHFPIPFSEDRLQPLEKADGFRGNPIDFLVIGRALVAAMQEWIEKDVLPPPSAYPRIDMGTLVPIDGTGFPSIPGVMSPRVIHEAYRADYGVRFSRGIIDRQPPVLGEAFPSLVSRVDGDGNEIGGIRPIEIQVPLATYTPWHLREGMAGGNGELTDFWGMFLPFPRDAGARELYGDPRASIAERYASRDAYLAQVKTAAAGAAKRRHLLEEDIPRVLERAGALWDWITRR